MSKKNFKRSDFFTNNVFLIALTMIIPLLFWVFLLKGHYWVDQLLDNNRSAIYSTLTGLNGTLLGFTIAAATIVIGYIDRPNLTFIRQSVSFSKIGDYFLNAITLLSISTFVSLIGLIGDRDKNPSDVILCIVLFGISLGWVSLGRALILFSEIVKNIFISEERPPLPTKFTSLQKDLHSQNH